MASFEGKKSFVESQTPVECPLGIGGIVYGQQIICRVSRTCGVPIGNLWHRLRTTNHLSSLKDILVPCGNLWHRLRTTDHLSSLKPLWRALWEFVASFED